MMYNPLRGLLSWDVQSLYPTKRKEHRFQHDYLKYLLIFFQNAMTVPRKLLLSQVMYLQQFQ